MSDALMMSAAVQCAAYKGRGGRGRRRRRRRRD